MITNAIILVAGKSTRFDSNVSKQSFLLKGKPVFAYPLEVFNSSKLISNICVVSDGKNFSQIEEYIKNNNISKAKVILGGERRQDSVRNGINFFNDASDSDYLIIHDGARPLIDEIIIENTIEKVGQYEAVTTCVPMEDTVAVSDQGDSIIEFVDRSKFVRIQTPQAFKMGLIREAYKYAKDNLATDDCSLVMALPHQIKLIPGSKKLTKLTTIEDLKYLETFIK